MKKNKTQRNQVKSLPRPPEHGPEQELRLGKGTKQAGHRGCSGGHPWEVVWSKQPLTSSSCPPEWPEPTPPAALPSGPSRRSGGCKGGPWTQRDPHPQLLGDTLPVQVAVLGCDGLQLGHLLFAPLLLVDARVLVVLPELADLLRAAASLKLQTDKQTCLCGSGPRGVRSLSRLPGSAGGEAPKAIHAAGPACDQRESQQA